MPLRVDVVYSDQSNIDWKENVTCRSCGTAFVAVVRAHGTGSGRAVYGVGGKEASDRAGMESFSNAAEEGQGLIRLRRCARCRKSLGDNGGVALATALRTGVAAFFLGSLPMFFFLLLPERLQSLGSLVACPSMGAIWWWLYRWQFGKRVAEADRRVQLERVPQMPG